MRVKTGVTIFISAIFAVLIIGLFRGWNFTAIGTGIIGFCGAIRAALRGRSVSDASRATDAADKAGDDARTEASRDAESMDSVVRYGEGLVEQSEDLIRETGRGKGKADRKP